jgi:hypothetical protein
MHLCHAAVHATHRCTSSQTSCTSLAAIDSTIAIGSCTSVAATDSAVGMYGTSGVRAATGEATLLAGVLLLCSRAAPKLAQGAVRRRRRRRSHVSHRTAVRQRSAAPCAQARAAALWAAGAGHSLSACRRRPSGRCACGPMLLYQASLMRLRSCTVRLMSEGVLLPGARAQLACKYSWRWPNWRQQCWQSMRARPARSCRGLGALRGAALLGGCISCGRGRRAAADRCL